MSLIELTRYNFRFNAMQNTNPSGMYSVILKNSNGKFMNNILGNTKCNIKSNFAILDNSNVVCTQNIISGKLAILQGNAYLSEFSNTISSAIPNISITCNSFYNFPTNLVRGDLGAISGSGFGTPINTKFTGNQVWSRYLINDGINYKLSDVSQNTIFWNDTELVVNFDNDITLESTLKHLSRIPKNLNGRTLIINFSKIIAKQPIKIQNFYNGKVIVNGRGLPSTFDTNFSYSADMIAPLSFENITNLTIKNLDLKNYYSKTAKHAAALFVKNVKYLHIENCIFDAKPITTSNYTNFYIDITNDSLFWEHLQNYNFISNIILVKCLKTTIDNCTFNFSQVGIFTYGNTSVVIDNYIANAKTIDLKYGWKPVMPYFVYAAGNSSVAAINKKNSSKSKEYIQSIVQTGSFFNHTHKGNGLNISQMPSTATYCRYAYKIPVGAILIAPKTENKENALYLTSASKLKDIRNQNLARISLGNYLQTRFIFRYNNAIRFKPNTYKCKYFWIYIIL